jgi:erythromycin esterase-like protein
LVVWAHNSHVGDARATDWHSVGQHNLGQLMRERRGASEVVIVGFSTHLGTVTAASDWDAPAEFMTLRPSLPGSWERALHDAGVERGLRRFAVITREARADLDPNALDQDRLQRAVGVIYRPQSERASHYFNGRLARQYDVVLHYDETRALEPLERWPAIPAALEPEPPETYPFGV